MNDNWRRFWHWLWLLLTPLLPAMCIVQIVKGRMVFANTRKRRRKPSSERLCVERKGRGGGGGERNRENGMSRSTHDNKEEAVVVNGGHRLGGGEIGSVPIVVERTEDSSSSGITMKREGGDGGGEHRKEEGGGGSPLPEHLRLLIKDSSFPSSLQCRECQSSTKLMEMTTSSSFQHNDNVSWISGGLRGTPTEERGGQNNNYVRMSRKLSVSTSITDDVVLSSYVINDSREILEHGSSPRTPDRGNLPLLMCSCTPQVCICVCLCFCLCYK